MRDRLGPAELRAHVRVVLGLSHHGAHQPDRVAELVDTDQHPKCRAVEGADCLSDQLGADHIAIIEPVDIAADWCTNIESDQDTDQDTDRVGAHLGANLCSNNAPNDNVTKHSPFPGPIYVAVLAAYSQSIAPTKPGTIDQPDNLSDRSTDSVEAHLSSDGIAIIKPVIIAADWSSDLEPDQDTDQDTDGTDHGTDRVGTHLGTDFRRIQTI